MRFPLLCALEEQRFEGYEPKVDNFIDMRIGMLKCFKHKVGENMLLTFRY